MQEAAQPPDVVVCPSCGEENPARFRLCGFCGSSLAPASALADVEERRMVTIVFSDLKGSTNLGEALDSEVLREVMSRYFDAMTHVLRRHGGTIEKFIGDAIMAVFGLPRLHEDDALRAVRAASEMTTALQALNDELDDRFGVRLTNRTGVNTGEVVAGDPTGGQRLVTGDAVNVAARLEQAAPANEVLIGELTYRLTRDAIDVEPVEPLELKGKSERIPAYRLLATPGLEGYQRRIDTALVGRELEMSQLEAALDAVVSDRRPRLMTVLADAGVGKSRLVAEFTRAIAVDGVTVVRGRCLPYGEGITFWPLAGAVREAAGIEEDDPPEVARARLTGLVPDRQVTDRVAAAIGLSMETFAVAELVWGARRFFEVLAASGPLCVVFDDIHWAEDTFLELIGDLISNPTDAPVFVLATARHDMLEEHPEWGHDERSELLLLEPLAPEDVERVVANLLGGEGTQVAPEVVARIAQASEGNALFIEQLLAMLVDAGSLEREGDRWVAVADLSTLSVPPTIQALLSARLNRLARPERAVLEPAAVIGLEFATAAVMSMAPESLRDATDRHLAAIVRRQLLRARTGDPGDDPGYRFAHILIRDAAYGGLLKRARATYHEAFVAWADQVNAERDRSAEFEEILGYHLEQAYRYLEDLGPLDDHGRQLATRAAQRLVSAGRRALSRGDMPAAANLLQRASELLPANDERRLEIAPDLGEALWEAGRFDEADALLTDVVRRATAHGLDRLRLRAGLVRLLVQLFGGEHPSWSADATSLAEEAIPVFAAAGDHAGQALAWRVLYAVHGTANRYADATAAAQRVVRHAEAAGDIRLQRRGAAAYVGSVIYDPIPATEAIAECERLLADAAGDRRTEALVCEALAQLYAMRGETDLARQQYRRARLLLEEIDAGVLAVATSIDSARVELHAGDLEAADRELSRDYEALSRLGERFLLSSIGSLLARVAVERGDVDRGEELTLVVESIMGADDLDAQALWRGARSAVLAARGDLARAVSLAREAVEIRSQTDSPVLQADAHWRLGTLLALGGDVDQAAAQLDAALERYEAKGDLVLARAVADELDVLRSP